MSTTTNLSTLKINYLTQEQYDTALGNNQINENELYLTPGSGGGDIDVTDMTEQEVEEFVENLNGQAKSGEYRKLLWTNPNPTSLFAAQNISLDLSDYDDIEIISKKTASESYYFYTKISIGSTASCDFIQGGVIFDRTVNVLTTQVEFSGAQYLTPSATVITADNTRVVPYKIYGIKYEHVYPPQAEAADYIIEQGISGMWTYRKWNSGIAECWGTEASRSYAMTTNYGNGVWYESYSVSLPSGLFVLAPTVTSSRCAGSQGTGLILPSVYGVSTTTISFYAVSLGASNTLNLSFAFSCKGRWK